MKILGISYAVTYGGGVSYEIETLHNFGGKEYIITWGFNSHAWHKFRNIRSISKGYSNYRTIEDVNVDFKGKNKKKEYIRYLENIYDELKNKTKLDIAFSYFTEEDLVYYPVLCPLVRKIINNVNTFNEEKKNKIIKNRKSYLESKYGCLDGYKLIQILK
jgi:hypothetical protein